jgi:hypothetical protein
MYELPPNPHHFVLLIDKHGWVKESDLDDDKNKGELDMATDINEIWAVLQYIKLNTKRWADPPQASFYQKGKFYEHRISSSFGPTQSRFTGDRCITMFLLSLLFLFSMILYFL